jgi:hypothetical protein
MWRTWNTSSPWRSHLIRVLVVALAFCVSACTGPGDSSSAPSAHSPEGGHTGPLFSGNGNGGSGM